MGQSATLVAGLNLDGEILKVLAMTSIPSLVDYGWNERHLLQWFLFPLN
ncbi:hypothetical protein AB6F55_13035 [Providencia hangzhouensis]